MINSSDFFLDFAVSSLDAIALPPEQMAQAAQLSDSLSEPAEQWQTYLNILALFGFKEWLGQRVPELVLQPDNIQSILSANCQVNVGEFKIHLLSQGTLNDEIIALPRTALELPNNVAHFYVLVAVNEEQEETVVEGFIRYDQLIEYQQSGILSIQPNEIYEIPIAYFDPDPNHLLLYLKCLDSSAIQLPNTSAQLEKPENQKRLSQLVQPVINVGLWLQGELDEFAERLSWMLLPTPALATAPFRSFKTFSSFLQQLQEQGMSIPNTARGASQNIILGNYSLQLYALAWVMEEPTEWSLLLILGSSSNQQLPEGLKLQISDASEMLGEQEVEATSEPNYLYMKVVGELDEQFITTIINNGDNLTLPPFIFFPNQL